MEWRETALTANDRRRVLIRLHPSNKFTDPKRKFFRTLGMAIYFEEPQYLDPN